MLHPHFQNVSKLKLIASCIVILTLVRGVSAHLPKEKPLKGQTEDEQKTQPMRYDNMARKYVIGDSFFHGEYIPLQATTASGDDYLYHKSHPPDNSDNVNADSTGESDVHPFHDFAEHAKQVSEDLRQKSIDARRLKDQLRETGSATQSVEQSLEDIKQKLQQHQQQSKVAVTAQLAQHVIDHHLPEAESPDPPDHRKHHHHHHGKHKREKPAASRDHQLEWLNYLAADNAKRLQDTATRLRNAQWQPPPVIEPEPARNPLLDSSLTYGQQPPPILPHVHEPAPDPVHEHIQEHLHEHLHEHEIPHEHVHEPASTPTPQPQPSESLAAKTFDSAPIPVPVDPQVITAQEAEQGQSGDSSELQASAATMSAYHKTRKEPQRDKIPLPPMQHQPDPVSQRPPDEQIFYNGQFYPMSSDQISKLLANMGYVPVGAAFAPSSRPSQAPTRKPHGMGMPLGERIHTSGVEGRFRNPSILRLYRQHRLHIKGYGPDELISTVDTGGPPAYSATQRPIQALAQSYDTRPPQPVRDDQSYESSEDYDDGYAYADMEPRRRRPPPHHQHPHHHHEPVRRSGPTHHYSGFGHSHSRHPHHQHHRTDHAAHSHAHKSAHGRHHHEYKRRHDHTRPHAHHTPHNLHQHQVHRHQLREAEYAHRHVHHAPRSIQQASQQTIVELLQKLSQTQKQLELPPVAVSDDDRDDDKKSPLLEALEALDSNLDSPGEPPPRATKTGAIVLGVLGALWLSYIGYLNNVTEE